MGWSDLPRHAAVALLGLAASCGVQAQITKCIDTQGSVTYSDAIESSCRNANVVGLAETTPATARDASRIRRIMMLTTGNDALPARPGGGVRPAVAHAHATTDAATVGAAREALASTDRALAAMRMQKLASSR